MSSREKKVSNLHLSPNVSLLVNQCKAKAMEYRIIKKGEPETKENYKRMTIVVDTDGNLVKKYWG
jgi:hypothetical protein